MNLRAFYKVLSRWATSKFDRNDANCCHFVADVLRCWGIEHVVPDCDDDEAAAWFKAHGCDNLYEYLIKLFGQPVAPLQARRGFIVYRKGLGLSGSAIGTVDRTAVFVTERGLMQVRLSECAAAFNPLGKSG